MHENAILLRCDHDDDAWRAELRHAKIGRLAYYIWQIGGEQTGQDEVDWLIAEHILETAKFRTPRDTDTPAIAQAEVSGKCQDSVPRQKGRGWYRCKTFMTCPHLRGRSHPEA